MVSDAINGFSINHHFSKHNKVGNVFPYFGITINEWVARLLRERDFMISKIHHECFFVWFFMISVA